MNRGRARVSLLAVALALVLAASGCTTDQTDVSAGVNDFNKQLEPEGLTLDCPKQVKGGEGTIFPCTLKSTRNGKSAPVQLKVAKESGDLVVDAANQADFDRIRQQVAGS